MIKYFRFSWEEIMWGMSYQNLIMLSATIPVYKSPKERKKEKEDDGIEVGANELANFLNLK